MAFPNIFPAPGPVNPSGYEFFTLPNKIQQALHTQDPPQKKEDLFDYKFDQIGVAKLVGGRKKMGGSY